MKVLGIDLAAQPKRTFACSLEARSRTLRATIHGNCHDAELIALGRGCKKIAIDAPFGWPDAFVDAVRAHRDRGPWPGGTDDDFNELYFRHTDRSVAQDRRPLSVAADKLGVTAMRCARLLDRWPANGVDRTGSGRFVEVYPAAALMRWGLNPSRYKGREGRGTLKLLAANLQRILPELELTPADHELVRENDDAFDALIAALVGRAAALKLTDGPPKERRPPAQREGWIHLPLRGALPFLAPSKAPRDPKPSAAFAERVKSGVRVDDRGYVTSIDDVFIPTVSYAGRERIEQDLVGKGGNETVSKRGRKPKFLAAHSSSALAANSFAPFLEGRRLPWGRYRFSGDMTLERECPTGLDGVPPTLDFVAEQPTRVLAIESKCIEHFQARKGNAPFKKAYARIVNRMSDAWHKEYKRLLENPLRYRYLDAPQLVKHYLGLKTQFSDGRDILLAYVYWEPVNAEKIAACNVHKAEVAAFEDAVDDRQVKFVSKSYPELWAEWSQEPELKKHVAALRRRYAISLR